MSSLRRAVAALVVSVFSFAMLPAVSFAQLGNGKCDRQCLEGFVDRYLDAVIANDPSAVPLATQVRFTENGQRLMIGDGLWNTMKSKGSYRLFVADVPAGQVGFVGTIQEDHANAAMGNGALLALRLRIENDAITEVEQFVARSTDAWDRVSTMGMPRAAFTEEIPRRERMSRGISERKTGMKSARPSWTASLVFAPMKNAVWRKRVWSSART